MSFHRERDPFAQDSLTADLSFEPTPHTPPPLPGEETFPSVIDNSMTMDFRTCEEKWFKKHCRKIVLLDDNVHLISGGAYARGLEVTRKRYFDSGWPMREALREGIREAIVYYGAFDPHGRHAAKTIWRVIGAMEHHFNRWPINSRLQPFKLEGTSKHTIEFSFAKPIPGCFHPETGEPLIYAGRFDFLGINLDDNLLGPVDDKTTTQLGDYWMNKWSLNNQMFGYGWAAKDDFPELAHLIQCAFIRGVSILKTKFGDADARCYFTDESIAMWLENLKLTVENMIRVWERFKKNRIPYTVKNLGGACSDFGGCSFKTLCESATPEIWIPVHFTKNEWDPLRSRD